MRILMIFTDAIRVDKLSVFNKDIKEPTVIDEFIKKLGGKVFKNCFTSSPDTYRSLASLFTGLKSWKSNCNSYSKPLNPFCDKCNNIWDDALNNNFYIDIFHSPFEKYIFPRKCEKYISNVVNIQNFISKLVLKDNHIVWIGLNDFRHNMYYSKYNYRKVNSHIEKLRQPFNLISTIIDKFDYIFLFSDHGALFDNEFLKVDKDKKFQILDNKRTQVLMFYKNKWENGLTYDDNLYYLSDMNILISNIINKREEQNFKVNRKYLIVEDMDFSTMVLSSRPSLFSLITKEEIYVRSFLQKIGTVNEGPDNDKAFLLNRHTLKSSLINPIYEKDILLFENNNFKELYEIYNFWLKQMILRKKIRKELKLDEKCDLDSMGKHICYNKELNLFSLIAIMKKVLPPILFDYIKKYVKR